ncbi:helix-turn-helix domain-containing protein [Bacillus niameyensis]|uniref:helix-turn-helix domain-containing protein n=1 Tax=Bacillus niameyensis TaxID=1522308 RepID=UPI000784CD7D|nr:helix-turn-helix transcriptional regulator [Bacillus niameyensis]
MANINKITNNLKALREERGIKQKFIAEKLGITPNYYSQIENCHRPPQLEHLLILRDLFNVSLDDIFFNGEIANCDKVEAKVVS